MRVIHVLRDAFKLGGFVYTIVVQESGENWSGSWFCPLCGQSGEVSGCFKTSFEAELATRDHARDHHLRLHDTGS